MLNALGNLLISAMTRHYSSPDVARGGYGPLSNTFACVTADQSMYSWLGAALHRRSAADYRDRHHPCVYRMRGYGRSGCSGGLRRMTPFSFVPTVSENPLRGSGVLR